MIKLQAIISFCTLFTLDYGNFTIGVLSLASKSRTSSRKIPQNHGRATSSGTGFASMGFASQPKEPVVPIAEHQQAIFNRRTHQVAFDDISKETVSNLFSVCCEIQRSKFYQPPKWADECTVLHQRHQIDSSIVDDKDCDILAVVAKRNVSRGQVLTLFPIHALGIRIAGDRNDGPEFMEYNRKEDEQLFENAIRLTIPLDTKEPAYSVFGKDEPMELFAMSLPRKGIVPGWLGGVIKTSSAGERANCVMVPLPGAAPLCAVVSTQDIKEGDEFVREIQPTEWSVLKEIESILAKEYRRNISTLSIQIEMALDTASLFGSTTNHRGVDHLGPFHQINLDYPGLKRIHRDPDIYAVDNFLTVDECDRIVAKARPHLSPCLVYKEEGDENSVQDPWRTSTNANIPRAEVPSVVDKIANLSCCSIEQLEILQVLNYKKGQQFKPHTDGFSGPYSACGFEQSTRLATVFCYLNDVSEGGSTYFPVIDLDIKPRKGTAIIHFPADMNMREDKRTLHQGKPAIDEKWLLTTWVWISKRTDEAYAEWKLPPLSSDII
ncbi:hypothetical protein HJC23_000082 [Cyclotella cryptica]|uniref:Fe2OG dioxygenase domain-containing protein n=1 Tax=Cyclotella cryptica TaxID=29204 RepID=A0ABD3PIS9_9STRA|eukprot:CCRYP_014389-RA/>CCRYP_014389-RA protein AED:0.00 eAED:0.00 QI:422/-1/1/1/-1/1/1/59/549